MKNRFPNLNPLKDDLSKQKKIDLDKSEIVRILLQRGQTNSTEIAFITGWSRPKVLQRLRKLVEIGLIEKISEDTIQSKKWPNVFRIGKNMGYLVGIDVHVSDVHIYLSDLNTKILQQQSEIINTGSNPENVLELARQILLGLISKEQNGSPDQVLGIGICVSGSVDFDKSMIVYSSSPQSDWEYFDFRKIFKETFSSALVVVDSDVNILTLAEKSKLPETSRENFIYVSMGKDIKAGIVSQGNIHRGFNGCAGNIGHICVDKNGPSCSCGNNGCLNTKASEIAMVTRALDSIQKNKNSSLAQKFNTKVDNFCIDDLCKASLEGDPTALEIMQVAGTMVGEVLAGLANFFVPSNIIIGGNIRNYDNHFLVSIRSAIYKYALPLVSANLAVNYSDSNLPDQVNGTLMMVRDYIFS